VGAPNLLEVAGLHIKYSRSILLALHNHVDTHNCGGDGLGSRFSSSVCVTLSVV